MEIRREAVRGVRFQTTPFNCGPASVQNGLEALGIRIGQRKLAEAAGTTADQGTGEEGIKAALLSAGRFPDVVEEDSELEAWDLLTFHLVSGRPVVCCVDRFEHWVTVIGMLGSDRLLFFDPAKYDYNLSKNGVNPMSRKKFIKRWKAARRDLDEYSLGTFYGIAIGESVR
jgi:hypothetical protein